MKGKVVIIDGREFDEYTIDTGNQIVTIQEYIPTETDILQSEKQNRIAELENLIDQKVRLGDDVQELRSEYRALLGL